jgi:TRAP-type C4-dicarboxylate transport system substrate-binding protein
MHHVFTRSVILHDVFLRSVMRNVVTCVLALIVLLSPVAANADPIKLRLSFFTSDRSVAYTTAIKPFVDAVNADGKGIVQIEVYFSGTLGKVQRELPQLVLDGGADIAFIIPGQNPERFLDSGVMGLPGLFHDVREATLVHTRLAASGALAGYKDFYIIGAYGVEPESIHSRKPIRSLADLKDQRIRVNNFTEATALAKLGALPIVLAFNETAPAISSGSVDGAMVAPAQLFDVGIGRLLSNHYMLLMSTAPLSLVMNLKVFEKLPENAKAIIRKYSGDWAAARFIEAYKAIEKEEFAKLKADPRRTVVIPSAADLEVARRAFKSVIADWVEESAHHRELMALTQEELEKIRATR